MLAHSLRRTGTAYQLAVLVTPAVSAAMRQRLQDVYNVVQEVNVLDSQDAANLALLARPELGVTFTKLHCWRLVQFEKCVFLDADTLVRMSELMLTACDFKLIFFFFWFHLHPVRCCKTAMSCSSARNYRLPPMLAGPTASTPVCSYIVPVWRHSPKSHSSP